MPPNQPSPPTRLPLGTLLRATAVLPVLLISAGAQAQVTWPHLRANPRRAQLAGELARRQPEPSPPPDGGATGNPDSGVVVDGADFWWIGSTSPNASYPNSGIQAVIDAVNMPPSSGCFGCWTSAVLNNEFWGQLGFSACSVPGSPAVFGTFYQVWDLKAQPQVLLLDGEFQVASEGPHTYAMALQSDTTWGFSVDGTVFGSYDMGSAASTGPSALVTICEEGNGVAAPYAPGEVSMPIAMSILNDGGWSGAPSAVVYNSVGLSGVNGNLQDSSLPDDAISIGGDNPYDGQGTELWSGVTPGFAPDAGPAGATPLALPFLRLTSPVANTTVSGVVIISGSVTNPPGAPAISQMKLLAEDGTGKNRFGTTLADATFSSTWDTTQVPNEVFYLYLQVFDALGRESYIDLSVTVDNVTAGTGGTTGGGGTTSAGASSTSSGGSTTSAGGSAGGAAGSTSTSSSGGTGAAVASPSGGGCSSAGGPGCWLISSLLLLARRRANRTGGRKARS